MTTRRSVLEEAAKAVCFYCRGIDHNPIPEHSQGRWLHSMTKANGWNSCSAGAIWELINQEKEKEAEKQLPRNSCNRHHDCKAASAAYFVHHGELPPPSFHCHDEECEECFGN